MFSAVENNLSNSCEENLDKSLDVFISYRRSNGSQLARYVCTISVFQVKRSCFRTPYNNHISQKYITTEINDNLLINMFYWFYFDSVTVKQQKWICIKQNIVGLNPGSISYFLQYLYILTLITVCNYFFYQIIICYGFGQIEAKIGQSPLFSNVVFVFSRKICYK